MTTVRGTPPAAEVLGGLRLAVVARGVDRAGEVAGPLSVDELWLEHVAAELADQGFGRGAEHLRRLRVEVADAPIGIDGVDALDHALQHRLGLGLALAQRRGEVEQVPAHVVHRARERLHFLRALCRDRGGEVALPEAFRGICERLDRCADAPSEQERGEQRSAGEQDRHEREPAHEARDRSGADGRGQPRLDQQDRLAGRSEHRQAGRELAPRRDFRDGDCAGCERLRMHVPVGGIDGVEPRAHRQEADLDAHLAGKLGREAVVEAADCENLSAGKARNVCARAERPTLCARDHERLALFRGSREGRGPGRGLTRGDDGLRPVEQRAGVEPRRAAEPAQEELQLHNVALPHEARERRPARQQACRHDRFLADAADLVARLVRGGAHLREGLLRGLVAQEPERGERDCDDGEEHESRGREQQQALERARPRQQAHEARLRLPREPQ